MPDGKPAGVPCVQLDPAGRCRIFGQPQRPAVCSALRPTAEMCRNSPQEALTWLTWLETETQP